MSDGHPKAPLVRAVGLGFRLLSYSHDLKGPREEDWPRKVEPLYEVFHGVKNYGVMDGAELRPTKYLVDVDWDWEPGIAAARKLMPWSDADFGRLPSKPISHSLYTTSQPFKTVTFKDPIDNEHLVQLRGVKADGTLGHQTMIPPSVHPETNELLRWAREEFEPRHVENEDLLQCARFAATMMLIAKYWPPKGVRRDLRLAYSRVLLEGLEIEDELAVRILTTACEVGGSDDNGIRHAERAIRTTRRALNENKAAVGGKTVKELLPDTGHKIIPRLYEWFGKDNKDIAREKRLALLVETEELRREARRIVIARERGPSTEIPEVFASLRERLAGERTPVAYRIDGWQPMGARVILAAQFKAGKTTLAGNLIRCLVDGDRWLDSYTVSPIDGAVALLDVEMSADQVTEWLAEQNVENDDRVLLIPLRGRAGSFNILDNEIRREWARRLQQQKVKYFVLDCLRPVLDALGLDEHHDAGKFLTTLDELLHEAGIDEALIVQHMGHLNERSRGDSRLRDWPDVEWRLVRSEENPAAMRFISAYGRDVEVGERQLSYEPSNRRVFVSGGSRADVKNTELENKIIEFLATCEPKMQSGRAVRDALGLNGLLVTDALKRLRERGLVLSVKGEEAKAMGAKQWNTELWGLKKEVREQRQHDIPF